MRVRLHPDPVMYGSAGTGFGVAEIIDGMKAIGIAREPARYGMRDTGKNMEMVGSGRRVIGDHRLGGLKDFTDGLKEMVPWVPAVALSYIIREIL